MPARVKRIVHKKDDEPVVEVVHEPSSDKAAWVVEEIKPDSVPEVAPEEVAVESVVTHPEPEVLESPIVPQTLDIESKSGPPASMAIVIAILASFVVGAVVGIAGLKLKDNMGGAAVVPSPAPTVAVTPTVVPTTAPEIKRSEIKVAVLNGSGKTGAASKMADELKALGYTIQRTGNASADVDGPTEVHLNDDTKTDWAKLVISDLKKTYEVAEEVMDEYDSSSAVVVVVIGSE